MTSGAPAALSETHSAVVVFIGDRAYKAKKPVDLGFLDFSTREAREAACHREVALNRRLAPDVYLGVADVFGPDGEPCDHLVVMRRMPDERRLARLVREGAPVEHDLRLLAHQLASFHAGAERSPAIDSAGTASALADLWTTNTTALRGFAGRHVPGEEVDRVRDLALRYLEGREGLFDRRIADGRVCDGHGDLLADDIFLLDDGPRVLDCLDFDDRLRHGDALADVAFLAMDLERLGRADLAASFLDAYRELAGDWWPASLAHHHVAYRAQVRAKVSAIRADQGDAAAAAEARMLLAMAHRHLGAARVRLVLVGGLPGTGKSTLSQALAERLGFVVLRSDEIRKELAGIDPLRPAPAGLGQGIYDAATTEATYAEVLVRARVALAHGESVVLDASWLDPVLRERARGVATATAADLYELRCTAPAELAHERMRRRAAQGGDPSDATPEVHAAMAAQAPPWPAATTVDTTDGVEAVVGGVSDVLSADAAPSG